MAVLGIGLAVALFARGAFDASETDPGAGGWPPPADVVALGRAVYAGNCASCHGAAGEGEPGWQSRRTDGSYPAPPHDATGHTWHHADGLLFAIIRDGGARLNIPGFRSGMPAWGDALTDDEIRAVITYMKTLWGPRERSFQAEVSASDPMP
ncbi:MAG: cytochrome c [Chloroflexi bacterium]|nr:cytochrome c [Chloroflexota bacterium]